MSGLVEGSLRQQALEKATEFSWLAANEVQDANHERLYGACSQGCCYGGVSENAIRTALEVAEPYLVAAARQETAQQIETLIDDLGRERAHDGITEYDELIGISVALEGVRAWIRGGCGG